MEWTLGGFECFFDLEGKAVLFLGSLIFIKKRVHPWNRFPSSQSNRGRAVLKVSFASEIKPRLRLEGEVRSADCTLKDLCRSK